MPGKLYRNRYNHDVLVSLLIRRQPITIRQSFSVSRRNRDAVAQSVIEAMDAETFQMFRDTIRSFVNREIKPVAREWEHAGRYPTEIVETMKQLGLFGLTIDEAQIDRAMDELSGLSPGELRSRRDERLRRLGRSELSVLVESERVC